MATAPDPAPAKQIEELLTCCICTETLDEPKTLPCFHSFCKRCLARCIEVQRENAQKERRVQHQLNCPMCRTQFEMKQGESVEQIPPNYFINSLLEMLPVLQQQMQKLRCESCKSQVPATCRCIECESYLCQNCLKTHNDWQDFEQHVVLTLEELVKPENQSKAKGKPRCKKEGHENKPLEFYCNICQELACISCVVLNHSKANHDNQPIATVAEQYKKALKTTSDQMQAASTEVKIALKKINQATQSLDASTEIAKGSIRQQEEEILQDFTDKLRRNTAELLSCVDRARNMVNEQLVKQHNEMKAYHEKVNGSLNFANNIVEKASNDEIILNSQEIQANAKDIKKECPKMMEPIHDGSITYRAKSPETIVANINLNDLGNVENGADSLRRLYSAGRMGKEPQYFKKKEPQIPKPEESEISGFLKTRAGRNWRKRWYVLKDKVLYISKSCSDPVEECRPLLGYEVQGPDVMDGNNKIVFQLTHAGVKSVDLKTDDVKNAQRWVDALRLATSI
ncbi:E3 ubiquitin-protein ligase TRIM33-like isoform X2 [Dendronephthya gigantea]|uniref:E3 ubiquitin-protein ligase TRIM33-like isoform X2 n=1 Tax=Dendronephthya gigantea TaxID=151771 RepID=UPI00106A32D2|nr:E3 ubiquitin-protein ligase TRIM33-like isoform X2 [Dendronephthya gigantea]